MDFQGFVKNTLAYGGYFNFPLFPVEVHRWLISPRKVSYSSIRKYLPELSNKDQKLRQELEQNTKEKEAVARKFIKTARFIPGIRLIALTGSVAANNSKREDDIDLLIVTSPNTLWLIRPIFLLLLSIKFHRRHPGDNSAQINNAFCPNLWLDLSSLSLPRKRRNLYTAHEVLQIKPLLDRGDTYQRLLNANKWVKHFLANAFSEYSRGIITFKSKTNRGLLFAPLNLLCFFVQYLYMLPKITTEDVSPHTAFFHKNDPSTLLTKHLKNNSL